MASPLSGGGTVVGAGEELLDSIGEDKMIIGLLESEVEDKLWRKDGRPGSGEEIGTTTALVLG